VREIDNKTMLLFLNKARRMMNYALMIILRSLIEKLEEENRNLETKLEDQYRERATRDQQIQEIGIQVSIQSSSKRLLKGQKREMVFVAHCILSTVGLKERILIFYHFVLILTGL
jgi:hypothetical protein